MRNKQKQNKKTSQRIHNKHKSNDTIILTTTSIHTSYIIYYIPHRLNDKRKERHSYSIH